MVLVQNKYKNTLVGVLRTQITFATHSSPSCYVTLRTQVIRLNSGNLDPQKTDSGVFIIMSRLQMIRITIWIAIWIAILKMYPFTWDIHCSIQQAHQIIVHYSVTIL